MTTTGDEPGAKAAKAAATLAELASKPELTVLDRMLVGVAHGDVRAWVKATLADSETGRQERTKT